MIENVNGKLIADFNIFDDMKATLEISMYPLSDDYINIVVDFVKQLHLRDDIRIETNGLSTQIFSEYDCIMDLLQNEVKEYLGKYKSVFIFKLACGEHTPDAVHSDIKNLQK